MFCKGDLIVYGNTGVCRVEKIGHLEIQGIDKEKVYYTLTPIYSHGVIYAPVDTQVYMRPVLSKKAADELISRIPCIPEEAYYTRDQRLLSDHYRASFETHQCEDLLQLIKAIYVKGKRLEHSGKKPGQIDQRYMKRAEDLLYGELAVALGIPYEKVLDYIQDKVSRLEQSTAGC